MKTTLVWTMILFTLSLFIGLPHTAAVDTSEWGLPDGAKARLGKGMIREIVYSPDGTLLAVASSVGIWLYDAETLQERALLTGHIGSFSIAFSPDGKTIVSGSYDNKVRLWDVATATLKHTLKHIDLVLSVSFSPDGRTIAGGSSDNTVRLWDVETGTLKHTLTGHTGTVYSVSFSPDGRTIASGSRDDTVRLWDAETATLKHTLTGHTNSVYSVSFSPDSKTIASGSNDWTVRLWDVETETLKHTLKGHRGSAVFSVSFSPDGKTIASGSVDKTVRLWDVATATHKGTLTGHTDRVISVSFSPDGTTLASAGGWSDETVRFWDVTTETQKGTLTEHIFEVRSVSFSPDGRTIASGSWGEVLLWDVATGTHKHTLTGHTERIGIISFSPDGRTIASGSRDKTVRLWDAETATHRGTLKHTGLVHSVLFSPDGSTLVSAASGTEVLLWDVETATYKGTLTEHTGGVGLISFSPDGTTLASTSGTEVLLWDVETGTHKHTLTGHTSNVYSVSFSPDGKTIASGSIGKKVLLWDVETATLKGTLEHTSAVRSVSFSPDGRTIAIGDYDKTVSLWDVATGTHIAILFGHTASVNSVSFSPNGTTLASGSDDGTVLLWDLTFYLDIAPETPMPTDEPDPSLTLQSDTFDGSGQDLQSFWQVQNGDKSSWELKDGQLVVDAGFNQNLWYDDTSTRFYQVTDQDQFTVETSMVVDYADVCVVSGLVVSSPTTESSYGEGEWVMLKFWGRGGSSVLQYQHRGVQTVYQQPDYNPVEGPTRISMRLERNGDDYTAWFKPDAEGDWVYVGKITIALQEPLQVGLYTGICQSESQGHLTTTFDYFQLTSDTPKPAYPAWDVNEDGSVNILDLVLVGQNIGGSIATVPRADVNGDNNINILDLVLVAGHFGETTNAAAPDSVVKLEGIDPTLVKKWLELAQLENDGSLVFRQGIANLERLLTTLIPQETALLANYPNPFNPETWMPYQLAKAAEVRVSIYAADGKLIRTLALGHQVAGVYHNRNRAAYWDGKNAAGESVASGVYFYTLSAGDFTATRRMLILK